MTSPRESCHSVIRLRGHHLLCLFGFKGLGYDDDFIAGMAAVVRRLRQPGARVEIVAGPDDICAACPHAGRERCQRREAHPRDAATLAALGLPIGYLDDAATLFADITARITPERLDILCAGCSWQALGLCAEGIRRGAIALAWDDC